MSDDGYRIPVLGFYTLNKYQYILNTPLGAFKQPGGRIDTVEPYKGFGDGTGMAMSDKQKKFAEIFAKTRNRPQAIMESYDVKDRKIAHTMACKLLKMTKVKNLVDKLTAEAMSDLAIDRAWILERLKKIADEGDADGKGQLPALKELVEIIGIKTKVNVGMNLPLSDELMTAITGKKEPVAMLEYEVTDEDNGEPESGTLEEDAQ